MACPLRAVPPAAALVECRGAGEELGKDDDLCTPRCSFLHKPICFFEVFRNITQFCSHLDRSCFYRPGHWSLPRICRR